MSATSRERRSPSIGRTALGWLSLAAALWVLNFALTFQIVWPTPWIGTRHELSIEIAVLVLGLAVLGGLGRPPSARVVTVLAVVLCVMAAGRYGQVAAAALYGRPVHLYFDAPHLPNVAAMLAKVAPPWMLGAGAFGVAGLLAAVFWGLRRALARVAAAAAVPIERRAIGTAGAALLAVFSLGHAANDPIERFTPPVAGSYSRQAAQLLDAMRAARSGALLPPPADFRGFDTAGVAGADVLVVFLESYGAVSYDRPEMARALAGERAGLAAAVESTGRRAASAFVESPTFAGASWLAHASFMSAVRIDNGGAYERLLASGRDTLPQVFKRSGYRAVAVMPGVREDWPDGAFFGFDAVYDERALEYAGPEFGWWRIPDQYALAKVDALEGGEAARPPLLVFFPTISTHVPFRPAPPYQPDWARVLTARPFDSEALDASFARRPEWLNLAPAYVDSLRYAYEYWAGYLMKRADDDLVLILLGDHQPAASVAGQGARWDVPVHVIASRPCILAALRRAGFGPGLVPRGDAIAPMHALAPLLLDAFAAEPQPSSCRSESELKTRSVSALTGD